MGNTHGLECEPELSEHLHDTGFYAHYSLAERVRCLRDGSGLCGARCRVRRSRRCAFAKTRDRDEGFFVTFELPSMISIQMLNKAIAYHTLSLAEAGIPTSVATVPSRSIPFTNWRGCEHAPYNILWLVTEYVPFTLSSYQRHIDSMKLLDGLMKSCRDLHVAGFMHGDIAPDNVGVRRDSSIVFIDLGLSCKIQIIKLGDAELHKTSQGHRQFMSVAQHEHSVYHPADDIESVAYVALWWHTRRTLDSAEDKRSWLSRRDGDKIECEIRRIVFTASTHPRTDAQGAHLYKVSGLD